MLLLILQEHNGLNISLQVFFQMSWTKGLNPSVCVSTTMSYEGGIIWTDGLGVQENPIRLTYTINGKGV